MATKTKKKTKVKVGQSRGGSSGATSLRIDIASRDLWEPQLAEAMAELPATQRNMLPAILETLHDRHCGISLDLAAELVPILASAGKNPSRKEQKGWGAVYARLQRELHATGTPGGVGMGLLLNADPPYTLFRLVEPVMRQATRQLGRSILLCADRERGTRAGGAAGVSPSDYKKWSDALSKAVASVANDNGDPELNLFWRERAAALAARSRHAANGSLHLPDAAPYDRAAFYRTQAEPATAAEPVARLRPRQASVEYRGSAAEEGFDGIKIERGLDRLTSMLHTEYLNHPAVLADRIVNTGYFAFKRFARRESLRHVFLAGLGPPALHEHALGPFVKACWFEFAMRASHLLARSALVRSQLLWGDGDALGRVRSLQRRLEQLPETARRATTESAFRRHFMHDMQWLPDLLNDRGGTALELPHEPDALQDMANWLRYAWYGDLDERTLKTFGLVHVMVLAPTSLRARLGGAALAETLRQSVGFTPESGRCLAVTWVPDQIDDYAAWDIEEADGKPLSRMRPVESGEASKNIATWLQDRWMAAFRKELSRG